MRLVSLPFDVSHYKAWPIRDPASARTLLPLKVSAAHVISLRIRLEFHETPSGCDCVMSLACKGGRDCFLFYDPAKAILSYV